MIPANSSSGFCGAWKAESKAIEATTPVTILPGTRVLMTVLPMSLVTVISSFNFPFDASGISIVSPRRSVLAEQANHRSPPTHGVGVVPEFHVSDDAIVPFEVDAP